MEVIKQYPISNKATGFNSVITFRGISVEFEAFPYMIDRFSIRTTLISWRTDQSIYSWDFFLDLKLKSVK